MSEGELTAVFEQAWTTEGFVSREHEEARLDAGREALRRFRQSQLEPGAIIPASVEREFAFTLDGDRVRGRMDRVDLVPLGEPAHADGPDWLAADPVADAADVVEPALPLLRERVVITDYKSSDVRDPAKARERARDSLQLTIYAMAWQAETGRLPDAVALHFLDSGVVGTTGVDAARIERGVADIRAAAAGIRAGRFEASPSYTSCSWCAYRAICPSSVAR
jgi:DNA helicase-2/ATP-dependent DNA helicase PcrA